MSTRTKEETEAEIREKTKAMPGKFASNLFENPDFLRTVNSWMLSSHIQWAISMGITFVGLNYGAIWATQAFSIPPFDMFAILTPLGAAYMIQQTYKWKWKQKKNIQHNNDTIR